LDIPHKHDAKWHDEKIKLLPVAYRLGAIQSYKKVWLEAYELEEVEHKKENKARFSANSRLLNYVERITEKRKPHA